MAIHRNENVAPEQPWDINPNAPIEEQVAFLGQAYRDLWEMVRRLKNVVEEHDETLG